MSKFVSMNEWSFTGEIFYLKELNGEFKASVRMRGSASRLDATYTSNLCEIGCLLTSKAYDEAKEKNIGMYKTMTVSGHIESWANGTSKNPKVMFIADYVMEVA